MWTSLALGTALALLGCSDNGGSGEAEASAATSDASEVGGAEQDSGCPDGEQGCSCYANDTCNDALSCEAGTCVAPGDGDGDEETSGDGDGDEDTGGDGDGDGDGDVVPPFALECIDGEDPIILVDPVSGQGQRFGSLYAASMVAAPGATFEVCAGVYSEDITFFNGYTLRGEGRDKTFFEGGHVRVAIFEEFTVRDLTFRGNTSTRGGAINFEDSNQRDEVITLLNVDFVDNNASARGGAVEVSDDSTDDSFPETFVTGCNFINNRVPLDAGCGGAIMASGDIHIEDSVFDNNAAACGGAIAMLFGCAGPGSCTLEDSRVTNNEASDAPTLNFAGGGGLHLHEQLAFEGTNVDFGAQNSPHDIAAVADSSTKNNFGPYGDGATFSCSAGVCSAP